MNMKTHRILSIDAWRDSEGWQWNNWRNIGRIDTDTLSALANNRRILSWMRLHGFLSDHSAGQLSVEDDGYNLVVILRSTREPIIAIEYGHEE